MARKRSVRLFLAQSMIFISVTMLSIPGHAQAPARTPYSAPGNWTVTTYRAGDTGVFLRCSAERHYEDGQTLTIAINGAGNFVLGFTSDKWTYADRSTHPVSIRVDSSGEVPLSGRVRILPVGPIVFVDLEMDSSVITEISAGRILQVTSADTVLNFNLAGSAAAISSANQCHLDTSA